MDFFLITNLVIWAIILMAAFKAGLTLVFAGIKRASWRETSRRWTDSIEARLIRIRRRQNVDSPVSIKDLNDAADGDQPDELESRLNLIVTAALNGSDALAVEAIENAVEDAFAAGEEQLIWSSTATQAGLLGTVAGVAESFAKPKEEMMASLGFALWTTFAGLIISMVTKHAVHGSMSIVKDRQDQLRRELLDLAVAVSSVKEANHLRRFESQTRLTKSMVTAARPKRKRTEKTSTNNGKPHAQTS